MVNGFLTIDPSVIKSHVIKYYKFLSSESASDKNVDFTILNYFVPCLVMEKENEDLMLVSSVDDVKAIAFSMDPDLVPGLDSFSCIFFQKAWHIVGEELAKLFQFLSFKFVFARFQL